MVLLDAITGFRRSELMALKWIDVDSSNWKFPSLGRSTDRW